MIIGKLNVNLDYNREKTVVDVTITEDDRNKYITKLINEQEKKMRKSNKAELDKHYDYSFY